jgi:hypothetical protein
MGHGGFYGCPVCLLPLPRSGRDAAPRGCLACEERGFSSPTGRGEGNQGRRPARGPGPTGRRWLCEALREHGLKTEAAGAPARARTRRGRGRLRQAGHRSATIGEEQAEMGEEHGERRSRIRPRGARHARTAAVPSATSKVDACILLGGVPPFRLYPSPRFLVPSQSTPKAPAESDHQSWGRLACEARLLGGVSGTL